MYLKDRIRIVVVIGILLLIGLTYWFTKSKEIAGYAAVAGMLIWLGTIFLLRKNDD